MDESEKKERLAAIPLFGEALDDDLLDDLASHARPLIFPAGTTLMASGDFGVAMYAIVDGQVGVATASEDGEAHSVAELGPGDIVGEMSLMTGARRNATVTATTEVQALEITKVTLEVLLARAPLLVERFSAVLAGRQAELDRLAAEQARDADDLAAQMRRFFKVVFG